MLKRLWKILSLIKGGARSNGVKGLSHDGSREEWETTWGSAAADIDEASLKLLSYCKRYEREDLVGMVKYVQYQVGELAITDTIRNAKGGGPYVSTFTERRGI